MQLNRGDELGSDLQSEINITPLVDVVLVLLIIFMVVVPILLKGYDVEIPRGILARAFSSSRSTKARRRMRSWRVDVQSATARGQTSRGAIPPPTATWISSSPLSSRYASKHLAGLPSGGHEGAAVARHCSLKETPSHPTAQLRPQ